MGDFICSVPRYFIYITPDSDTVVYITRLSFTYEFILSDQTPWREQGTGPRVNISLSPNILYVYNQGQTWHAFKILN